MNWEEKKYEEASRNDLQHSNNIGIVDSLYRRGQCKEVSWGARLPLVFRRVETDGFPGNSQDSSTGQAGPQRADDL